MMLTLVMVVLTGAPPKAAVSEFGCPPGKCAFVEHRAGSAGSVWQVTRLGVRRVDGVTCDEDAQDWWFAPADAAKPRQKLVTLCNNGYGAAGVGEDELEVKGTTFTLSRSGGSAWRWNSTSVVQLAPTVALEREDRSSFHASAPSLTSSSSWSWARFEGRWSDDVARCLEDGTPDLETREPVRVRGTLLPQLTLPETFRSGGWKTASLGDCSTTASFVTFGKQSGPRDASLRAVMHAAGEQSLELYLEVSDDAFVVTAAKWPRADHVELWLSDSTDPWERCAGKKGGVQWGLALDGTVNAGYGAEGQRPPTVEVARADGLARLKVTVPGGPWSRMALVYSDSDDGQKQKALLSTSTLTFASEVSFGPWQAIAPTEATCTLDGDALRPTSTRAFTPGVPVLR
jgi:hypothetical protein